MDKILIKNLHAHGIIGVYEHERTTPQSMLINITLYTDTHRAAETDDLNDCINYDALSQKVRAHAESAQRLTVEALAGDIADLCLNEKGVEKVRVRVEKPDALDFVDHVGVEIKRP
ncbi:MAG: dihydroneopterin aldolase [Anaerolineae bacterium]|jgi:FolB domain-containing protein|nr:dihydroneopterin aldolase [Anaerolineae bacterium]MBT7325464.1 dihydroneopterin aldolase [Anaerolineae bacterium]